MVLRRHTPGDGPALVAAINESLEHLAAWMAWAQAPATEASIGEFLAGATRDWDEGRDFAFAVCERPARPGGPVIGGCGLHRRGGPDVIEIGYWVHARYTLRGIARALAVALRDLAFAMGIPRVEIRCDERNVASASVARSAGFTLVGTLLGEPDGAGLPGRTAMIFSAERPPG